MREAKAPVDPADLVLVKRGHRFGVRWTIWGLRSDVEDLEIVIDFWTLWLFLGGAW
jgi:hypothetical protein